MSMKPKAALVKAGYTEGDRTWTAGDENKRGRISLGATEFLKTLAGKGWDIEGYTVSRASSTPAKPAPEPTVTKQVVSTAKTIADVGEPRYDEREWEAFYTVDGKRIPVGMRTVCNTCGASLTYHKCHNPVVWVDHEREIVVSFRQVKK